MFFVPLNRRQLWRRTFSIDGINLFRFRVINQQRRIGADAVHRAVDQSEHGLARNDRVEGVAAFFQNSLGCASCFSLHRGDGEMLTAHHGAHGPVSNFLRLLFLSHSHPRQEKNRHANGDHFYCVHNKLLVPAYRAASIMSAISKNSLASMAAAKPILMGRGSVATINIDPASYGITLQQRFIFSVNPPDCDSTRARLLHRFINSPLAFNLAEAFASPANFDLPKNFGSSRATSAETGLDNFVEYINRPACDPTPWRFIDTCKFAGLR